MGTQVARNLKPLGEHSPTAVELAKENSAVALGLGIEHFKLHVASILFNDLRLQPQQLFTKARVVKVNLLEDEVLASAALYADLILGRPVVEFPSLLLLLFWDSCWHFDRTGRRRHDRRRRGRRGRANDLRLLLPVKLIKVQSRVSRELQSWRLLVRDPRWAEDVADRHFLSNEVIGLVVRPGPLLPRMSKEEVRRYFVTGAWGPCSLVVFSQLLSVLYWGQCSVDLSVRHS